MSRFYFYGLELWVCFFGISLDATSVALLGLSLVLISGVLTFGEVLAEKAAWNTLVWFSALVMMATLLGKLGVTQFLAEALGEFASAMGLGEISIMIFLSLAFLYTHYFFASTTAHISAMFFVFYSAACLRSTTTSLCFYYDSFR
ncbi:TPA: anion permease [Campylobacter jejuni]|nr:anion permease [Campylobacter jejuni]MBX2746625.1 anion permease [Campylobacter jejuni]HDX3428736.1 anion permease [Campylobacter jejuni]HEA7979664.1 anion permease [Campylobacter jejuni]HEA8197367.1 anion permease [Campylobacter jejuni]